jgi:hypothetical protein
LVKWIWVWLCPVFAWSNGMNCWQTNENKFRNKHLTNPIWFSFYSMCQSSIALRLIDSLLIVIAKAPKTIWKTGPYNHIRVAREWDPSKCVSSQVSDRNTCFSCTHT